MILSGIISGSGKRARPPFPDSPPAPVYGIVGEPNADGTAGGTHNFQASNILAQRYTTGIAGRIVALLAYFHGTGTPSFRMSLYTDSGGYGFHCSDPRGNVSPRGPIAAVVPVRDEDWQDLVSHLGRRRIESGQQSGHCRLR